MRDLMRSLATLGSLSSSQVDTAGQFQSLISDTRSSLSGAISAMAVDVGAQGDAQTNLGSIKSRLSDMQTALKTQVTGVEDVDMATTLSNLSLTQTQLQSSYQLIASVSSLSLVKYLASG
jgi:flagellar hook-associated protein 3 FlgL